MSKDHGRERNSEKAQLDWARYEAARGVIPRADSAKCGAWGSWTRSTSPRWRTCSRYTKGPYRKANRWFASTKRPVVLHKDTRPVMPVKPYKVARRDYEYKRCGTANVFCGIEPKAGVHFTKVTPTRSSPEFADFILEIAAHYSAADTIHLVVDNLSTHTRKALTDRFGEEIGGWLWNRFTVHYTPTHGSWLNQAEIEISLFGRQCLGRRRIGDIGQLRRQTKAWNRRTNRDRITIQWKFTRKQARRELNYSITRS